jgi:hypothetical protein
LAKYLRVQEVEKFYPPSRLGALPATILWAMVLEKASSSTRFLFLSMPRSSESAGGGDVVELVSSYDSSASSPSWISSASGASDAAATRSAGIGPSSGRGGRETRNWWVCT